jgi:hypothetical protein
MNDFYKKLALFRLGSDLDNMPPTRELSFSAIIGWLAYSLLALCLFGGVAVMYAKLFFEGNAMALNITLFISLVIALYLGFIWLTKPWQDWNMEEFTQYDLYRFVAMLLSWPILFVGFLFYH